MDLAADTAKKEKNNSSLNGGLPSTSNNPKASLDSTNLIPESKEIDLDPINFEANSVDLETDHGPFYATTTKTTALKINASMLSEFIAITILFRSLTKALRDNDLRTIGMLQEKIEKHQTKISEIYEQKARYSFILGTASFMTGLLGLSLQAANVKEIGQMVGEGVRFIEKFSQSKDYESTGLLEETKFKVKVMDMITQDNKQSKLDLKQQAQRSAEMLKTAVNATFQARGTIFR